MFFNITILKDISYYTSQCIEHLILYLTKKAAFPKENNFYVRSQKGSIPAHSLVLVGSVSLGSNTIRRLYLRQL